MWLAVRANVRTANAARESGLKTAMRIAFRSGGVAGMFTVGLGPVRRDPDPVIYKQDATSVLVGFGFGGALLAMFMRVGGGIFTKAADVGADLVGKVEQGIPEDDPRNAADDRRQRGRQRRRLRRHGGRPVRVVRGHARRVADPGRGGVRRVARSARSSA